MLCVGHVLVSFDVVLVCLECKRSRKITLVQDCFPSYFSAHFKISELFLLHLISYSFFIFLRRCTLAQYSARMLYNALNTRKLNEEFRYL